MITFYNVRGNEKRTIDADLDPIAMDAQIAAYWNSSDQNTNGIVQDFGWRLAPETLKKVRDIMADEELMERIAGRMSILPEDVNEVHILQYIARNASRKAREAAKAQEEDYQRQYDEEVRKIMSDEPKTAEPPKTTTRKPAGKKVASPAELAKQKLKEDERLAKMMAEDAAGEGSSSAVDETTKASDNKDS